jgi:U3 small nucleolar RNA-associated protein 22
MYAFLSLQRPMLFAPPTSVSIVGSHATDTAIQGDDVVDVAVEMPASCFEHKDHLNHRYHAKRALYLAVLAQQLRKQPIYADQQWGIFNNDVR